MLRCSRAVRSALEIKTKGTTFMKHLDLYARRDPQLAPYLLREVDIEFKRKCRKVSFCLWVALATAMMLYNNRVVSENAFYMKGYAKYIEAELDALDEDMAHRRRALVRFMNLVKSAYQRDGTWTPRDTERAVAVLSMDAPKE